MDSGEFDEIVNRAVQKIPAGFRRRMENVAIVVEPEAPVPGLLGLYHGIPLTRRSVSHGFNLPDKITIYQRPHERMARDRQHLEKLVEDTVWHEVAHYFGMNELQVRRAERQRALRKRGIRRRPGTQTEGA